MTDHDIVSIDGREVKLIKHKSQQSRVLLYHKPEKEICTRHDPEGRSTIFEHLPFIRHSRWICVGRLDFNTSGLLLITNNGELANQLMHPRSQLEREYAVRVLGQVTPDIIMKLQQGVHLEDCVARFEKIVDAGGTGSNHWYHVVVKEGRNRLVRRAWEALGFTVSRLIRIRFGSVYLPAGLRRGKHIELTSEEITELQRYLQGTKSTSQK